MSKLAELAGTTKLRGKVCITKANGVTMEYADEETAAEDWDAKVHELEHRRGAFFQRAAGSAQKAPTPPPVAPAASAPAAKPRSRGRRKSGPSSSDDEG